MRGFGMMLAMLAVMVLAPMQADAGRGDLKDALSEVKEALDEARDDDDCSKRKVINPLKDVRDDLRDFIDDGGKPRKLKRIINDLRDVHEVAEDKCSRKVHKPLKRAVSSLRDAKDDLDDREDDREDRSARREKKAETIMIDCWDHSDPGCLFTRNGKHPMGKSAWKGFYNSVKSAGPSVFKQVDMVKAAMANNGNYITSKQLNQLVLLLKPNVFKMLDVVQLCAPRVVDAQNGLGIGQPFEPNSFKAKDAVKAISGQPHGIKVKNAKLQ